jgi:hypothetical protein
MANRDLDSTEKEKRQGLVMIPTSPSDQRLVATTNSPTTTTNGCLIANRHLGSGKQGHGLVTIPTSPSDQRLVATTNSPTPTNHQSLFAPMSSMDETRLATTLSAEARLVTALSAESRPAEECRVWALT